MRAERDRDSQRAEYRAIPDETQSPRRGASGTGSSQPISCAGLTEVIVGADRRRKLLERRDCHVDHGQSAACGIDPRQRTGHFRSSGWNLCARCATAGALTGESHDPRLCDGIRPRTSSACTVYPSAKRQDAARNIAGCMHLSATSHAHIQAGSSIVSPFKDCGMRPGAPARSSLAPAARASNVQRPPEPGSLIPPA